MHTYPSNNENVSPAHLEIEKPELNDKQIEAIGSSKILPGHKAQIIQFLTGTRLTMELWENENCTKEDIEYLLKQLPFRWFVIEYEKQDKKKEMYQVSVNKSANTYIQNNWRSFSHADKGVLYGYPTSTILAFANLIEKEKDHSKKTVAMTFIGPGFYSKDFWEQEREHYDQLWDFIKSRAPKIANECYDSHKTL